jgi:hypothetical protein
MRLGESRRCDGRHGSDERREGYRDPAAEIKGSHPGC